jgi:hypothetical protein
MDDRSPHELSGADCQRTTNHARQARYAVFREEVELSIGKQGWERVDLDAKRRERAGGS